MNEKQRKDQTEQINSISPTDKKSASVEKDYSKYFDFTGAKVLKQEEGKTTYRISGRDVTINEAPDLKEGKRRGKEQVNILTDFKIPAELQGMGEGKKFKILTYGCQMNEHDTEVMSGIFLALGYEDADTVENADVILLNTCAIRENAENKVFGEIGHLKSLKVEKPDLLLGVCGCMSQEESVVNKILKTYHHVDMIFGTHNIHRLPQILHEAYMSKEMVVEVWTKEGDVIENLPKVRRGNIKAWVNIMYGCDKFCTYCIVPYTRGKERSRRPEDIIQEVRQLAAQGYQEITLLGQNVNAYGKDFAEMKYGLGDLMDEIRSIGIPRIRFTTSHPRDFDDHLIEVLAKGGNLMEHIHLPVQSGSTDVLKIMARKYTREEYLELVRKIKAAIPNVALTTDIIVGYPNETEEQFEETLSLYREVGYEAAYTFIYSPREGTPAANMQDNVPLAVKKERLQRLNAVVNELSAEALKKYKGQVVEVLVEGESKNNPDILAGYTRRSKLVNFSGPKTAIGKIVKVKITDTKTWSLNGTMVEELDMVEVD
ncbi:tRNA (N6-isopentenyl adenosine(37)-C2)-methylthiotransferase MiaB [Bacillus benzoevorans]|uniref:tRNA-2-methylthio-N(6)-dimethylallyladenosine synthase n=1 Tax=Bacillus benzoevorans TaxID=1456 RepID=A0A7X0LVD9_9BACI|nr:tRNA (N6-isopentenyl adenosine(37)-C2)-methylthiotransferase MiaB [Bacillus benzoevorans]MBB6444194.1 tRNA-2-methylthio-N6-dimethylallyladenosine synthase [Bacillus benzoevorans]